MQTAEIQELLASVSTQQQSISQHDHLIDSMSHAVVSLNQQMHDQKAQLASLAENIKTLITRIPLTSGIANSASPAAATHALPATSTLFPVSKPDKFDGSPETCKGFLLQCQIYFCNSPQASELSRISFVVSRLSGKALEWATAVWPSIQHSTYEAFLSELKAVFDHPYEGRSQGELLFKIKQGNRPVTDYALEFRTLAAGSGWNEAAKLVAFRNGLQGELLAELACKDTGLSLDELIALAIRLDQLRRSHPKATSSPRSSTQRLSPRLPTQTPSSEPENMQCDSSRLSFGERTSRIREGRCLYCGAGEHQLPECPVRPHRHRAPTWGKRVEHAPRANAVSIQPLRLVSKSFRIWVCVNSHKSLPSFLALLDSGAEGNFIHAAVAQELGIKTINLEQPLHLSAVDGDPVGKGTIHLITEPITLSTSALHQEEIQLLVLQHSIYPIILGLPWLQTHNPVISWKEREITHWSPECLQNCTSKLCSSLFTSRIVPQVVLPPTHIPGEYSDLLPVFSKAKAMTLPPHREYDCAIALKEGASVPRGRIYPLTMEETQAMETYIKEALEQGFIRPSKSPLAAGFFFVKKSDGTLRPCIDYRALNDCTVSYPYPLPLVPAALEQLRGATWFTKLDLRNAYNLVRIKEGDEWKTAFSTATGHYEYLVMPFGLSNAPSVFQSFINDVLRDMLNRFVIAYMDDILIYSPDFSTHVKQVRSVLTRLLENQLYVKAEKCEFHLQRTSFLGYIISPQGVAMDDKKVTAVTNWPIPASVKALQRFLGFANFYRRFIRNYSTIASPLTNLLKGATKTLKWHTEAKEAFNKLKQAFTSAPVLQHPNPQLPFLVEVDASEVGVGGVLSQRSGSNPKLHPIAFFSHKLTPTERNYGIGDRELLAIKLALEEWRHWLEGALHPFTVLTDHKNLEYLRTAKRLNPRQARWSLFFSRFRFTLTYRPGTRNTKADVLSRIHSEEEGPSGKPVSILPSEIILAPIVWSIDKEIDNILLQEGTPNRCPRDKKFVPNPLRDKLIAWAHSSLSSGHPGETRTLQLLRHKYWWDSMGADIHRFVSSCSTCAQCKTPKTLPAGKLMPLPVPERPWSHLAVDFVTDLPSSQGFTTILTVIDRFSRGVRFIPFKAIPSALQTAEALFQQVFRLFGIPEDIVSDRGPQFTSQVWRAFFERIGVTVSLTSGYHPQANGQCERANQELGKFLRLYCYENPKDWSHYLPWAEMAQNSLLSATTRMSPFQCFLGYQPTMVPWSAVPCNVPAVETWMQRSEQVWEDTHQRISQALARYKRYADIHRGETPSYEIGDRVWLSTRDFRNREGSKKLSPKFIGPFRILKKINDVTYSLDLPRQFNVCRSFHVSLLKPVIPGPLDEESPPTTPPPPMTYEGTPVYAVKRLLNSRRRAGVLQYLVDWEGYGPEERSWVPSKDVLDQTLKEDFHRRFPNHPAPRPRGRPRRQPRSISLTPADSLGGGTVISPDSLPDSEREPNSSSQQAPLYPEVTSSNLLRSASPVF